MNFIYYFCILTNSVISLQQSKKLDNKKLIQVKIIRGTSPKQTNLDNIKTIDITKNQKLDMTIQYIDKNVNIIGTKEQMSKYKYREVLISY